MGPDEPVPAFSEGLGRVEPTPKTSAYGDFGDHVAGVLSAAETAAEEIRAEAESDAEAIRRAAHAEAEDIVGAARRVRAEAEEYVSDIRLAVEAYANQHRRQAEDEARTVAAEAEAEARATREAAEAMASRLDEEAGRRRRELAEGNRALEGERRRILEELREVAGHLEDVLAGSPPPASEGGSTLSDALSLRRRR